MAIKKLQTRIALKYDSFENWQKSDLVLLAGELGICTIGTTAETGKDEATINPTVLFKVGDGTTPAKNLKWASALAADVYNWAKSETVVLDGKVLKFKTGTTVNHTVDLSAFALAEEQNFTDEQKEIARNNIDAVDANLVVSSLSRDEQIPNGAALKEFFDDYTMHECVRIDVRQEIPMYNQGLARSNIGAVSQAELGSAVIDMVSRNELIGAIAETKATVVSASEQQNFTDEQKEIARNNIDATGIYIGSGEMPEGYDIQIDTDGDVYSITNRITDDTNTEIPSCEAVKNYVGNTISTTDDGNGNITLNNSGKKVEFTDDGNGNIKMEVM